MNNERISTKIISLPVPPSVNHAFFNLPKGGRAKTKQYNRWIHSAYCIIKSSWQGAKLVPKSGFGMTIYLKIDHRSDIDNRIKPTLDIMQAAGIFSDDRYCQHIAAMRSQSKSLKQDYMLVEIKGRWQAEHG